jgi:hypothetical protein
MSYIQVEPIRGGKVHGTLSFAIGSMNAVFAYWHRVVEGRDNLGPETFEGAPAYRYRLTRTRDEHSALLRIARVQMAFDADQARTAFKVALEATERLAGEDGKLLLEQAELLAAAIAPDLLPEIPRSPQFHRKARRLPVDERRNAKLFRNYAIGPFHERYEDRRAAELRPPLVQVCLQNRPCTAAGINLNMPFSKK